MYEKYILTTIDKTRYVLSESEKDAVFKAIVEREKMVIIQGDMVPLHVTPSIVKFDRWWASESEKLIVSGKKLCRDCFKIYYVNDVCKCWQKVLGKKQNAFIAEKEELPSLIKQAADIVKSFPVLTDDDKMKIEAEQNPVQYTQRINVDRCRN